MSPEGGNGLGYHELDPDEKGKLAKLTAAIAVRDGQIAQLVATIVEFKAARNKLLGERGELLANRVELAKNFARLRGVNPDTEDVTLDLDQMVIKTLAQGR